MQDLPTPGLRERKREQTRRRLENAAVTIVLDGGLDALTIDAVSERAEVSPRTFFNYFDSKEDAILGTRTEDDTRRLVTETLDQLRPTSLLDGIIELLLGVVSTPDPELHEKRHRIIREHPELLHRKFAHMGRFLEPITEGVLSLMERVRPSTGTVASAEQRAQIAMMACSAALRASIIELTNAGIDLSTPESTRLLHTRTAALVRDTTGILK
ncbi:TetR/AcrR family transcriptional regulator [Microbacterium protaetiae]|uniref:TetR/AcrR family transcriptional regulator n=1 Tax=Microbacterium protaetiae TaxID=2509458 RepID=UPI001F5C8D71|nr:TetR/AcrR family transcriptional regulator [Microbacterium protaetiae]